MLAPKDRTMEPHAKTLNYNQLQEGKLYVRLGYDCIVRVNQFYKKECGKVYSKRGGGGRLRSDPVDNSAFFVEASDV